MAAGRLWLSNQYSFRMFRLTGVVRIEEPLRIGAGKGEGLTSLTDLPILKISVGEEEVPVIPGSSWKGVIRSRVEAYLRTHGKHVCGGPGDTCMDRDKLGKRIEMLQKSPSEENRIRIIEMLSQELCMACKIFGAPSYASKVFISDSFPVKMGDRRAFSVGIKPGIAIDRRTGAARRGAFYHVEFIEPGSLFTFEIVCRNLPNYALGLIAKAILDLNSGLLRLGGFKTRGFGRISFPELRHEVSGLVGESDRLLRGFTEKDKHWFDPEDRDVEFDGTTWGLLGSLAKLADSWLGGVGHA